MSIIKTGCFCLSLGLLVGSVSDSGGFAPYLELMGFYISQLLQLLTDVLLYKNAHLLPDRGRDRLRFGARATVLSDFPQTNNSLPR